MEELFSSRCAQSFSRNKALVTLLLICCCHYKMAGRMSFSEILLALFLIVLILPFLILSPLIHFLNFCQRLIQRYFPG